MPAFTELSDRCRILAIADPNPENATKAAQKFEVPHVFSDFHELLQMDEIDAVCIATPNLFHKQAAVASFEAGKHVFCEKPMARNAEEAREMLRAQKKSGKLLQIGFQFRFSGAASFMRKYIENGNMGEIYYARVQALRRRGVPGWGVFIDKEQQGGGPLLDIGVHVLDFTLYLMGYPKPVSASGKTFRAMATNPKYWNAWGDYDRSKYSVEDFAVGFIRFENEAIVTLESSFMANIEKEIWRSSLFGTEAGADIDLFSDDPIRIYTEKDQQLFDLVPKNVPRVKSTYSAEIAAFVNSIIENKPSPVPGEHGLILNAIMDAIYRSSETGEEEPVVSSVDA